MNEGEPDPGRPTAPTLGSERWSAERWPAEWEPHRATWLSWPHNRETWPGRLEAVERVFAEIAAALVATERVRIGVEAGRQPGTVERLREAGVDLNAVDWISYPTTDAWVRDHGAIFLAASESLVALDFRFDNWGRKYPGWELDDAVPAQMAEFLGAPRRSSPFVLEGGAIDGDGIGTVLTTESCLLHPNRAGGGTPRTRRDCEAVLEASLHCQRVIWLAGGIAGDDTDGHVDDVARFTAPGHVVAVRSRRRDDTDFSILEENWRRLRTARDARGSALELTPLPAPPPRVHAGVRLPASYANFYLANGVALVPTFGVSTDEDALRILDGALPGRRIVPIRCDALLVGLGAIHCCTKEEPAPELEFPRVTPEQPK